MKRRYMKDTNLERLRALSSINGIIIVNGQKNWIKLIEVLFGKKLVKENFSENLPSSYQIGGLKIMFSDNLYVENQTVIKL